MMNDTLKRIIYITLGLALTSLGVKVLALSQLTFGGTAGIASLMSYETTYSWGFWFFIVNIPFFWISIQQLGKWFTISSLLSITAISIFRDLLDFLVLPEINIILSSILAGVLIGIGITTVLNNGSSLGGIHILAVYFNKKHNLNHGLTIFVCDSLIILCSALLVGWSNALISIIAIFITSSLIGRYKKSPIANIEESHSTLSQPRTINSYRTTIFFKKI
jgi:uncharacterized membrane-anchored protein YitT (DUF2179 family)